MAGRGRDDGGARGRLVLGSNATASSASGVLIHPRGHCARRKDPVAGQGIGFPRGNRAKLSRSASRTSTKASSPSRAACILSRRVAILQVRHREESSEHRSADLACSGPACSVLDSREHVRDVGRGVARVCVLGRRWPNSAGRAPGEDTGISRPAPPFTPHAGAPAPPTPAVCSLGVNPVGAARVRSGPGDWARPGAGARLWRSCASGVQCMAQLAVRLPRPPRLHIAACVCVRSPGWRVSGGAPRALLTVGHLNLRGGAQPADHKKLAGT